MDLFEDIYNQTEKAVKKEMASYAVRQLLTLDNIYKYASDEELEAIVHSIIGRLWEQKEGVFNRFNNKELKFAEISKPTDKELHKLAKGLRKPQ